MDDPTALLNSLLDSLQHDQDVEKAISSCIELALHMKNGGEPPRVSFEDHLCGSDEEHGNYSVQAWVVHTGQ